MPLGRRLVVPGRRPVPDLPPRGQGQPRLGRRRQRVRRLPRRLRLAWSSATRTRRSPRRSTRAARTGTHFAAPTEATVALRRGALPALPARAGPLRQLGHRGDDGRDPRRARRHRPRRHRQDRGLVPRPPRRGDVLGRARTPTSMGGREQPASARRCRSASPPTSPSTRTSCRSTTSTRFEPLLDERGDEIACLILEPVMMNIGIAQPEPGYLAGPARTCCTSTARCSSSTR